jgi:hypothetical protein
LCEIAGELRVEAVDEARNLSSGEVWRTIILLELLDERGDLSRALLEVFAKCAQFFLCSRLLLLHGLVDTGLCLLGRFLERLAIRLGGVYLLLKLAVELYEIADLLIQLVCVLGFLLLVVEFLFDLLGILQALE